MDRSSLLLLCGLVVILCLATPAAAFGAGNIASISKIEGHNWRHGDIEDTLKTLVALKGAKWSTMNIRRVYFGNWLRDYSQALDVGTLKSINKDTIRILVWVLSFLSFGYATVEFEVTEERLGVYRPEEHIDNPKDYADNCDARVYDARLRPPVQPAELEIDLATGMKNYIANETGGWATSTGYVKHSLARCIHYGRLYTSGGRGVSGKEEDLCEALRCLGQSLHCLEDFSAHTNYVELALRELGFTGVFPHTGASTEVNIGNGGKRAFPIITGTFGAVDFLHSVLGEAQDKFSQTEVDEMDIALGEAHEAQKKQGKGGQKSLLKELLNQMPNCGGFAGDADKLEAESNAREMESLNISGRGGYSQDRAAAGSSAVGPGNFDPAKTAKDIYPILAFRDRVMRTIEATIENIPGLSALVEKISETLSLFVLSLLAPYIRPIIAQVSAELKTASTEVVGSSAAQQYAPWDNHYCTDPTHSLLSKDHFSNKLNTPAGEVASSIVAYVVPRIVFAWENPGTPVELVLEDVVRIFHHPALRDPNAEIQGIMFQTVQKWVDRLPDRGARLNDILGSEGVRTGKNHEGGIVGGGCNGGHGKTKGGEWDKKKKKQGKENKFAGIPGVSSTSGGGVSVAGVKLPGAVGGMLGGLLDAASQGYQDSGKKHKEGKNKDGKYKEEKHKDKYQEDKYKDHDKEKKSKEKKDKYNEGDEKKHKDKKEKDKSKDGKDKKDKKGKKDKNRDGGNYDSEGSAEHNTKNYGQHHQSSEYPGAYPGGGGQYSQHGGQSSSYYDTAAPEHSHHQAEHGHQHHPDPYQPHQQPHHNYYPTQEPHPQFQEYPRSTSSNPSESHEFAPPNTQYHGTEHHQYAPGGGYGASQGYPGPTGAEGGGGGGAYGYGHGAGGEYDGGSYGAGAGTGYYGGGNYGGGAGGGY